LLTEKTINQTNHAIAAYSTELGQRVLSPDLSLLLNSCTSGVADIERIGDHGENLVELTQFMMDRKQKLSGKALMECKEMFDLVLLAVEKSVKAIETEDYELAQEVVALEMKIDQMEKVLRARHIERLNSGKCQPSAGVVFIDILSNLERVGDHAHNLSMVVKDIKTIHHKQVK
jgi:phosphate:Na+ symporter